MTTTRFCIVRHGETEWNAERRVQGHIDIALNPVGLAQADAAARGIAAHAFSALYSSDLTRTLQTAESLARMSGISVCHEAGLRERHFGRMQGMTYEEMLRTDAMEAHRFRQRDPHHDFGGGESLTDFAARVEATIERLAALHEGQTLLLVTHGGVLDIIYRRAVGRDLLSPRDFGVPNAALNWIDVAPDGWHLVTWADQRHLDGALDEVQ